MLLLLAPKTLILMAPVFFNQLFAYSQTHLTISTMLDVIAKPAVCLIIWGIYKSLTKKRNLSVAQNLEKDI